MTTMIQNPDRQLIFTLRSYQQQVLELFKTKIADGATTFHIVAPPGSGKTVIGIALMLESLDRKNDPHVPLRLLLHECLDNSKYGGKIVPFDKWLKEMPDTAIAYARYLHSSRIEMSINVIWLDEMESDCTPDDYVVGKKRRRNQEEYDYGHCE